MAGILTPMLFRTEGFTAPGFADVIIGVVLPLLLLALPPPGFTGFTFKPITPFVTAIMLLEPAPVIALSAELAVTTSPFTLAIFVALGMVPFSLLLIVELLKLLLGLLSPVEVAWFEALPFSISPTICTGTEILLDDVSLLVAVELVLVPLFLGCFSLVISILNPSNLSTSTPVLTSLDFRSRWSSTLLSFPLCCLRISSKLKLLSPSNVFGRSLIKALSKHLKWIVEYGVTSLWSNKNFRSLKRVGGRIVHTCINILTGQLTGWMVHSRLDSMYFSLLPFSWHNFHPRSAQCMGLALILLVGLGHGLRWLSPLKISHNSIWCMKEYLSWSLNLRTRPPHSNGFNSSELS